MSSQIRHNKRYSLQVLKERDLSSLLELETQAFPLDSWNRAIFLRELTSKAASIKIIKCQNRVIGYVHVETRKRNKRTIGEIGSIAVANDHKGKGLGKKLLKHGIYQLRKSNPSQVQMQTRLDNVAMKSLAEDKFGFKTSKIHKDFYNDGSSAYQMTLAI